MPLAMYRVAVDFKTASKPSETQICWRDKFQLQGFTRPDSFRESRTAQYRFSLFEQCAARRKTVLRLCSKPYSVPPMCYRGVEDRHLVNTVEGAIGRIVRAVYHEPTEERPLRSACAAVRLSQDATEKCKYIPSRVVEQCHF